jgi:hypothetical protein
LAGVTPSSAAAASAAAAPAAESAAASTSSEAGAVWRRGDRYACGYRGRGDADLYMIVERTWPRGACFAMIHRLYVFLVVVCSHRTCAPFASFRRSCGRAHGDAPTQQFRYCHFHELRLHQGSGAKERGVCFFFFFFSQLAGATSTQRPRASAAAPLSHQALSGAVP